MSEQINHWGQQIKTRVRMIKQKVGQGVLSGTRSLLTQIEEIADDMIQYPAPPVEVESPDGTKGCE